MQADGNASCRCGAADLDYEKNVSGSFRGQRFMGFVGAELLRVWPGSCSMRLNYREDMAHEPRCFHPGVIGALAESAGEFAALSLMPPGSALSTIEYKLSILARGDGDALTARANVVMSGPTLTVCAADVYVRKERAEHLCATALVTFMPSQRAPCETAAIGEGETS